MYRMIELFTGVTPVAIYDRAAVIELERPLTDRFRVIVAGQVRFFDHIGNARRWAIREAGL